MDTVSNESVLRQLEEVGLSQHEAEIYLEILRYGEASVGMILEKVKLHREQAYRALKRLEEAKLVRTFIKHKRAYFAATNPEILISRVKAKMETAESLQPLLKGMYQHYPHIVQVREGEDAFQFGFEDILKTVGKDGEYLILGGIGDGFYSLDKVRPMYHKYVNIYAKRNINLRMISYGGQDFTTQYFAQKLLEVRELPGSYGTPVATVIYGDKVALQVMDPENISIIYIENKNIADGYRQQFETLWGMATVIPRPA
ncbi:MAG: helix-turn-helix domain-containing protein [bacterium]